MVKVLLLDLAALGTVKAVRAILESEFAITERRFKTTELRRADAEDGR